jgi:hypothetical protein
MNGSRQQETLALTAPHQRYTEAGLASSKRLEVAVPLEECRQPFKDRPTHP